MSKFKTLALLGAGAAGAYALRQQLAALEPKVPASDDNTVILYQFDYSPYCRKVRHILDYKKLPYKIVELMPMVHASYTRRVSGQPKVPYIRHKGQIIADSSMIALYLEEIQPEPALLPADPQQREQVLLLEDWLDESLQAALGKLTYLTLYLNPEIAISNPSLNTGVELIDRYKDKIVPLMLGRTLRKNKLSPSDLPKLKARAHEVLERLSGQLKGRKYLVGEQLSLADLALVAHLNSTQMIQELNQDPKLAWLFSWRDGILQEIENPQPLSV